MTGVGRRNVQRHHVHVCDLHGAGVLVAVEQDLLIIGGGLGFASVTGLTSPHGIDTTHNQIATISRAHHPHLVGRGSEGLLLRTVVAGDAFLHGVGQFGDLLTQLIIRELRGELAIRTVLQHIGILGQRIGRRGHQILILIGTHSRTDGRHLELRQLRSLKQTRHGHQLVILTG